MLGNARVRAKALGLPFTLVPSDIRIPKRCPVLDVPMSIGDGGHHRGSPSLDRIIPSLGYIKDNVQIISMKANTMKNDATPRDLLKFAAWINKNRRLLRRLEQGV